MKYQDYQVAETFRLLFCCLSLLTDSLPLQVPGHKHP